MEVELASGLHKALECTVLFVTFVWLDFIFSLLGRAFGQGDWPSGPASLQVDKDYVCGLSYER